MKRLFSLLLVLAAVMLAAAVPSFPASPTERVRFERQATIGGAVLEPGEYRLQFAPGLDAVTFYSGRRAVVTARCKVGLAQGRVYGDAVHFTPGDGGREIVSKLVFSSSRLSIELVPPAADQSPIAQSETPVRTPQH